MSSTKSPVFSQHSQHLTEGIGGYDSPLVCLYPPKYFRNERTKLEGLEGILDITDDILIYGVGKDLKEATEDHDRHLKALPQRCRERGMALNKDKLKLRRQEVAFMGHLFTNNGLKIDSDKARAVPYYMKFSRHVNFANFAI